MGRRVAAAYLRDKSSRIERETAMTPPHTTDAPLPLEPTVRDLFVDDEPASPELRELDHRRTDGIDVRLLWNPADDSVVVTVYDEKTGEAFMLPVDASDAMDAFHHPYAHAAFRGVC
jgi:hypothetical protein